MTDHRDDDAPAEALASVPTAVLLILALTLLAALTVLGLAAGAA